MSWKEKYRYYWNSCDKLDLNSDLNSGYLNFILLRRFIYTWILISFYYINHDCLFKSRNNLASVFFANGVVHETIIFLNRTDKNIIWNRQNLIWKDCVQVCFSSLNEIFKWDKTIFKWDKLFSNGTKYFQMGQTKSQLGRTVTKIVDIAKEIARSNYIEQSSTYFWATL